MIGLLCGAQVIPTRTMASAYHTLADPLVWFVWPDAASGSSGQGTVYEDDGESLEFREGTAATTTLSFNTDQSASPQLFCPRLTPDLTHEIDVANL